MAKFGCNVSFGSLIKEIDLFNKNNNMNQNDANNSKQQQQQQQQQNDKKPGKKVKQNIANVNDLVETCLHKIQKISVSKAFAKCTKSSIAHTDNTNLIDNGSIKDLSKLKPGDTLQICFLSNGLHVAVKLSDIHYIETPSSNYIFKGILQLNNKSYLINGNIDEKTANGEAELGEYLESEEYQNAKPSTSSCNSQIDSTTSTFQVNCLIKAIKTEPCATNEIIAPFLSSQSSQESLNEEPDVNPSTSVGTINNVASTDPVNKLWNKKRYIMDKYNQTNNDNSTT